ncbi:hypothetical protein ABZ807_09515 [Micromonospora sp. NPDC047548]|uniref:hypothetical protein n=1 Tax=Micromonospora sp. NPDC047548 TaxID=3155624 RepID=UPI0033F57FC1
MAYYLAPALDVLRAEIDTRWPGRDRTSDGWIGDAAHQASRSDHNPNSRGSVDAIDVDKDGVDVAAIIAAFERHPSAHYWIFNRQIADADDGWRRRPYIGPNPHDKHLHGSIRQTRTAEQDRRPWGLLEDDMLPEDRAKLDELHETVTRWRSGMPTMADGKRGIEAVRWRQRDEPWQKAVDDKLAALAARPPVVIDYDRLADAIVRRAADGPAR